MMSVYHQSNCKKAAKGARESGWRSPFALLLVHSRLFKSLSVEQLFDLNNDIGETTNVAAKHPEIVKRLMEQIENARLELGDCDRIGKGARFYDPQPKRPGIKKYNSWLKAQKNE
jgi:hypothetical protein